MIVEMTITSTLWNFIVKVITDKAQLQGAVRMYSSSLENGIPILRRKTSVVTILEKSYQSTIVATFLTMNK
jgi:hypothetical protein